LVCIINSSIWLQTALQTTHFISALIILHSKHSTHSTSYCTGTMECKLMLILLQNVQRLTTILDDDNLISLFKSWLLYYQNVIHVIFFVWLQFLRLSSKEQNFIVLTSGIRMVRTDWMRQFLQYLSLFWQKGRSTKSEIICQNLNHQFTNTILKIKISKTYIVA
jgi:hypothetical protein